MLRLMPEELLDRHDGVMPLRRVVGSLMAYPVTVWLSTVEVPREVTKFPPEPSIFIKLGRSHIRASMAGTSEEDMPNLVRLIDSQVLPSVTIVAGKDTEV